MGREENGMTREKKTTLSRQANRVAHKSNSRLSQEEWDAVNKEIGPWLIAMFTFMFAAMIILG